MDNTKLSWIDFYTEFADKLRPFAENRVLLIEKIKLVFDAAGINLPKLEVDGNPIDIDPFTVFGLFNKHLNNDKRLALVDGFAKEFSVTSPLPSDFDGVPCVNNQKATFYFFLGERGENDIDNLWNVFLSALEYADTHSEKSRASFIEYYDKALLQKGVKWNLTMGLFWIRPYEYLNLDSRNRWYMANPDIMPVSFVQKYNRFSNPLSGEEYLDMIKETKEFFEKESFSYHSFPEFSSSAWEVSESVNEQERARIKQPEHLDGGETIGDKDVVSVHYWIYSPYDAWDEMYNSGIITIGRDYLGDPRQYATKNDMRLKMLECGTEKYTTTYRNASLEIWQFVHDIKPGDIIIAKKGTKSVIGRGVVTSEFIYDESKPTGFKYYHKVKWTHKGEWEHPGRAVTKTLTDITRYTEYIGILNSLFEEDGEEELEETRIQYPFYTEDDFLEEVYMSQTDYDVLTNLLRNKKNVILPGAPGVGKTFAAKRLAYSLMGIKDPNRVMMVQFHQNYSYEDFIMGFRPSASGFELKKGPFYNFCKKAGEDKENDYFFIIDEINRGNLSKIFGELFMLIENDKRGVPLQLLYSDEKFDVPENVYIIGMMNTADRSLAILDYALRRRFAFFELSPAFSTEGFTKYRVEKENPKFDRLIDSIENLNRVIENDDSLGRGFRIGHSYFCTKSVVDDMWLNSVITYEILPLLSEYWFDEPSKVKNWEHTLRSSIQ